MKELFKELEAKYCNLSSYMIFCRMIRGRNLSSQEIAKWFTKLVNKEDYLKSEKKALTFQLYKISNG
jgi:hypothetical protein